MDWDNPTTKKHIKEATAQGCTLLGPGKSNLYRLYELPCGHEQQVHTVSMRTGTFRCSLCLDEKINQEAEAQGCKLTGLGKGVPYRLYTLPCGHEQEVETGKMRRGSFRCRTCLNEKLNQEAEAQGCKLLGAGRDANYRLFGLPCGHQQEVHTGLMRIGSFECKTCVTDRYITEAEAQGCKLIGAGVTNAYRLYKLRCGHEQEVRADCMREGRFECKTCINEKLNQEAELQGCKLIGAGRNKGNRLYKLACRHEQEVETAKMRRGSFRCHSCMNGKLSQEAEAQGCELLGAGRNKAYRLYKLPCGHEHMLVTSLVRTGVFECKTCVAEKLKREAEAQGCKLLGPGRSSVYRKYALPCGHEQEAQTGDIRYGNFRCQTCEETSRTQLSNVYLFHIKVGSDEWLKLGYAKQVDFRASRYGLPIGADVTTVYLLPFDTGNEAHAAEAAMHKRYSRKRLTRKQMMDFHTKGGGNECYPVTMLDTLLAELESMKRERDR